MIWWCLVTEGLHDLMDRFGGLCRGIGLMGLGSWGARAGRASGAAFWSRFHVYFRNS